MELTTHQIYGLLIAGLFAPFVSAWLVWRFRRRLGWAGRMIDWVFDVGVGE